MIRRPTLLTVLVGTLLVPSDDSAQTARGNSQTAAGSRISSVRIIDNERVSVSRLTFPAGAREQMHITPQDLVVVQASAGGVEVSLGSDTKTGRVEPGQAWYVSKVTQHAYSNVGTEPFDLLVVFLK